MFLNQLSFILRALKRLKFSHFAYLSLIVVTTAVAAPEIEESSPCNYILGSSRQVEVRERLDHFVAPKHFEVEAALYQASDFIKPNHTDVALKIKMATKAVYILNGPGGSKLEYQVSEQNGRLKFNLISSSRLPKIELWPMWTFRPRDYLFGEASSFKGRAEKLEESLGSALENAKIVSNEPLSLSRIKAWHSATIDISNYEEKLAAGRFRGSNEMKVAISGGVVFLDNTNHEVGDARTNSNGEKQIIYIYTAPSEVKARMTDWLEKINSEKEWTEKKVLRFVRDFIEIHPFSNGNGRVASVIYRYLSLRHNLTEMKLQEIDLIYDNLDD